MRNAFHRSVRDIRYRRRSTSSLLVALVMLLAASACAPKPSPGSNGTASALPSAVASPSSAATALPTVSQPSSQASASPDLVTPGLSSTSRAPDRFATSTPSPAATPSPTPQPTPLVNADLAGPWSLKFSDNFAQSEPLKWTTCYWWDKQGCTNAGNRELEWYQSGNVQISNNTLILTAKKQGVSGSDGNFYPYTSGMVTTGKTQEKSPDPVKFAFQYGFTEIRAKVPGGRGLWPAFWLLPANNQSLPEIDVMEVIGSDPKTDNLSLHYAGANGVPVRVTQTWTGEDLSQDWHVYGLDWEPDHISWYLDGAEVWRYSDPGHIPAEPMYLIINLAVGGLWPGAPDGNTVFPASMQVSYVRVWQKANGPTNP